MAKKRRTKCAKCGLRKLKKGEEWMPGLCICAPQVLPVPPVTVCGGGPLLVTVSVFTGRQGALELLQLGGAVNDDFLTIGPLNRRGFKQWIAIRPGHAQYFPIECAGTGPDYFIVRGELRAFDPVGAYETFNTKALCTDAVFDVKEYLWQSAT